MQEYIGLNIPTSGQKENWSFAGILSADEYPGWMMKKITLLLGWFAKNCMGKSKK